MARFTASIDDQLKAQLDTFAEENGYNRSQALELMIRTFFESKADTPQSSPPPPPQEAPSQPPTSPPEERLDELEAHLEMLQEQLRLSSPVNVRMDLVELQSRLTQMETFILLHQGHIEELHEVVVANADACVEGFTELETAVEFFVPGSDPPTLDWTESN